MTLKYNLKRISVVVLMTMLTGLFIPFITREAFTEKAFAAADEYDTLRMKWFDLFTGNSRYNTPITDPDIANTVTGITYGVSYNNVLEPSADAYVGDGSYGDTNYGSDTSLIVKDSTVTDNSRKTYLKFDLSTVMAASSVTLRVYGSNIQDTTSIAVKVIGTSNDWTESGITWNNAPTTASSVLSSVYVNNTAGYYEFDVTGFVGSQRLEGAASFMLFTDGDEDKTISLNSKESASFKPQLVISGFWDTLNTASDRTYLWSDTAANCSPLSNFSRLRGLAHAYATKGSALYQNEELKTDIINALDWIYTNKYNENIPPVSSAVCSAWDLEIGAPLTLANTMVLMYDQLTATQVSNYIRALDRFAADPTLWEGYVSTGANRADRALIVALRGVLGKSSAKIGAARDSLSAIFKDVTAGDGYYKDGSYVFHNFVPYTGSYGSVLLDSVSKILYLLHGSTWTVTDPNVNYMYKLVTESVQPLMYKGATMDMVRGRAISRPGSGDHGAGKAIIISILRLAQTAPPDKAALFNSMAKAWIQEDTTFSYSGSISDITLLKSIMNDSLITPGGELIQSKVFASMDRAIHRRPGFGFGLSLFSDRISAAEVMNGENLKGYWTGLGMTNLYNNDLTQYSSNYWPTVNSYRLPGTTTDGTSGNPKQSHPYFNSYNWAGGSSVEGLYSTAGMQFSLTKVTGSPLQGKKSWFMFGDNIVALGAGITNTNNANVETIVENRMLNSNGNNALTVNGTTKSNALGWSETMSGVNWAHLEGNVAGSDIGYYFPGTTNLYGLRESRTGAWSEIGSFGNSTQYTNHFMSLAFEHGSNPTNASYAYAVLPNKSAADMASYASNPDINILENSTDVQAVHDTSLNAVGANFWNDITKTVNVNGSSFLTSDKKASVTTLQSTGTIDVGVSDPTQANTGTINIEINKSATGIIKLDPGIQVTQLSPTIKMTVNVNGSHGKTFNAKFKFGAPALPATPTLNLATSEYGQVTLNWSNYGNATGYKIKYGTTPGNYNYTITVPYISADYTFTDLISGNYYFVISTYSAVGVSANSNELSAAVTGPINLANGKTATQSSTLYGKHASLAVDGNTNSTFNGGSVTHSTYEAQPWWMVDLGSNQSIGNIKIFNRTDVCCMNRLGDYNVSILDQNQNTVWTNHQTTYPNPSTTVNAIGVKGRYVKIQLTGTNYLSLAEVQVFPYEPPASSNLKLWLRADAGVTSDGNGKVSAWADQSRSANNAAQATAGYQPTLVSNGFNGNPVIRFDGVDDNLLSSGVTGNMDSFTVIFVLKPKTVKGFNQTIGAAGGWGQYSFTTSANGSIFTGPRLSSRMIPEDGPGANTLVPNNWLTISYVTNNASTKLYKNGNQLAYKFLYLAEPWTGFKLGVNNSSTIDGDIAEVLVYNTALLDSDRQRVEAYLKTKYSLATSISVNGAGGANAISAKNGSLQMQANVLPAGVDQSITWSVYEEDGTTATDKAVIDSNGLLTASKDGIVTVVVTAVDGSGVKGSATITISGQTISTLDTITAPLYLSNLIDSTSGRTAAQTVQQVTYLFDNNASTNSDFRLNGSGAGSYITFDFKDGNQVTLSSVELLGRQDQNLSTRINGTVVQGSNDNANWTTLSNAAVSTAAWQTLTISGSEPYRYIRMYNPNAWFGNMAELRFHGIVTFHNKIASASMRSIQNVKNRIIPGNTVKLTFNAREAINNVKVAIQGQDATVSTQDYINWTAVATLNPNVATGPVTYAINYKLQDGTDGYPAVSTAADATLYLADESDLIRNVSNIANLVDSTSGRTAAETLKQVNFLFDYNSSTNSDFRLNGGGSGSYITFDFKEGNQATLSSVELLGRQDQNLYTRINGTVVQGSNDNANWTTLSNAAVSTAEWQKLAISGSGPYRYIRIYNPSGWFGNMAELRLYGAVNQQT
ncbi:polysaccharide lyase family 8 super-sandwich domain-containing protein [Bacillus sp. FJAT-28004]|uniref:polysaccharide lyase family 8 super-sandwich domain-containing protein n=1 Tax=Bacillus sp. FJAT-28004 TaxID=1679165 RepID=UPI0006B57EE9|nr:polysaccharide lyase family 8 super-sandwich domain-containing protein [Bacillus sp. FJAT-28004]